jgi:hypothetical protein
MNFDAIKLANTVLPQVVANTVVPQMNFDAIKLATMVVPQMNFDAIKLATTMLPRFNLDIARLARDVEIASRRLESQLQQELCAGGLDADVVTWWTCLSPGQQTFSVTTIVWIFVLARLATWSAEYPDVSKYIQDHTGITPVVVATAAACAARAGYKWCSSD